MLWAADKTLRVTRSRVPANHNLSLTDADLWQPIKLSNTIYSTLDRNNGSAVDDRKRPHLR